jgi:hypothetical protein
MVWGVSVRLAIREMTVEQDQNARRTGIGAVDFVTSSLINARHGLKQTTFAYPRRVSWCPLNPTEHWQFC